MPKVTVYRFLQTVTTLGCVRQESDTERDGLTMRMHELGARSLRNPNLVELAEPHMQRLSVATGETVHLGMLIDSEIICVHKVANRDISRQLGCTELPPNAAPEPR